MFSEATATNWWEPNRIIPGLFLGSANSATSLPTLRGLGITHILMVGRGLTARHPGAIIYKHIDGLDDTPEQANNLAARLVESLEFISAAMARPDGAVLVHCQAGISRSATVVIAHLMRTYRVGFEAAHRHVRQCRPCIDPNIGFERMLRRLEHI